MQKNNYLNLEEIVENFIEKIKYDESFRKEYLKNINKSFFNWDDIIEIPLEVEKERITNFINSNLYKEEELNQVYTIKLGVLKEFLEFNPNYTKVHLELIRLDSHNDGTLTNFNYKRLLFAFYTDVNTKDKYLLIDVDHPVKISDNDGTVKNNIFKDRLKNVLDKYIQENTKDSLVTKTENTKIITLSKVEDIIPLISFAHNSTNDYFIELTPAVVKDSFTERIYYRKAEYNHQYTLIIKGHVVNPISKEFTKPFDTFCLNPPDNC